MTNKIKLLKIIIFGKEVPNYDFDILTSYVALPLFILSQLVCHCDWHCLVIIVLHTLNDTADVGISSASFIAFLPRDLSCHCNKSPNIHESILTLP